MSKTYLSRSIVTVLMSRRHTHWRINGRGRCRTVGSASRTRVVLASAPAETDARVTNRIALHLVDGHLSSVALDELHETASLARRDLDVGDLAKALEERTQLVLGDIAREPTNEDSGVVGISELIHRLGTTIIWSHLRRTAHWRRVAHRPARSTATHHVVHVARSALILGSSGWYAHRAVAAIHTLHLRERALLVALIGEANEAIATGHAGKRIGHDFGRLARREAALEKWYQDVFVDFGTEIANEDRILGGAIVAKSALVNVKQVFCNWLTVDQQDRRR
jgi:hypothetical protein